MSSGRRDVFEGLTFHCHAGPGNDDALAVSQLVRAYVVLGGGEWAATLSPSVSHVVASDKSYSVPQALKDSIALVSPSWVIEAVRSGSLPPLGQAASVDRYLKVSSYHAAAAGELLISLQNEVAKGATVAGTNQSLALMLNNIQFCTSQVPRKVRQGLVKLIEALGGQYDGMLTADTQVLLIHRPMGAKYKFAKENGIPMLMVEWLLDSVAAHTLLPLHGYVVAASLAELLDSQKLSLARMIQSQLASSMTLTPQSTGKSGTQASSLFSVDSTFSDVTLLLAGTTFCLTEDDEAERASYAESLETMGARVLAEYSPSATHLLCVAQSSPEYQRAVADGLTIVTKFWVHDCSQVWQMLPPTLKPLYYPVVSHDAIPNAGNLRIAITRYAGDLRKDVRDMIVAIGAKYTSELSADHTHLIAAEPVGEKYTSAVSWGVTVVSHFWIEKVFSSWTLVDTAPYTTLDQSVLDDIERKTISNFSSQVENEDPDAAVPEVPEPMPEPMDVAADGTASTGPPSVRAALSLAPYPTLASGYSTTEPTSSGPVSADQRAATRTVSGALAAEAVVAKRKEGGEAASEIDEEAAAAAKAKEEAEAAAAAKAKEEAEAAAAAKAKEEAEAAAAAKAKEEAEAAAAVKAKEEAEAAAAAKAKEDAEAAAAAKAKKEAAAKAKQEAAAAAKAKQEAAAATKAKKEAAAKAKEEAAADSKAKKEAAAKAKKEAAAAAKAKKEAAAKAKKEAAAAAKAKKEAAAKAKKEAAAAAKAKEAAAVAKAKKATPAKSEETEASSKAEGAASPSTNPPPPSFSTLPSLDAKRAPSLLERKASAQANKLTALGASVIPPTHDYDATATHIVLPKIATTAKFLSGLAAGVWMIKPSYIAASVSAGELLTDFVDYEYAGNAVVRASGIWRGAPAYWRKHRQDGEPGPFVGMSVIILGGCLPRSVIEAGGGSVLAVTTPVSARTRSAASIAIVAPDVATKSPDLIPHLYSLVDAGIPLVSKSYFVDLLCSKNNVDAAKYFIELDAAPPTPGKRKRSATGATAANPRASKRAKSSTPARRTSRSRRQ
ncbi:uncharacterized protein AMSG_11026 [Thecamonas trahens ATCC 50062]|uniref:BRCT domain-containing protein n=1 Tax=Thecamonas trahens ATCC 50062 TaxID=461836 RepID=A0A0L0DSX3_THETB|nr:hypothetical protein AMSG_11026 [Thecamonas trahens ATCC 50062]KNC55370.1 hypothetical protein AMSG_11026 [Thecamonas trahens ATCC 50062]|eukprot:XP_013753004.1 hypothetical protein AMSG_11026 [Thecamonas trahens ATCC 50062]